MLRIILAACLLSSGSAAARTPEPPGALTAAVAETSAAAATSAAPVFTLEQLLTLARQKHPGLHAARAAVNATEAGLRSAAAYPNPEVEYAQGRQHARHPGAMAGAQGSWAYTQKIDLPGPRRARQSVAEAQHEAQQAQLHGREIDALAAVKQGFSDLQRRLAEVQAAREDLDLIEAIRLRIAVRVESGEAARYELVKADAELLGARQTLQSAELRVAQARAALQRAVGERLPAHYRVSETPEPLPVLPPLATLQAQLQRNNPDLRQAQANVGEATQQLALEEHLRRPALAVRAAGDLDPELRSTRLGLVVTLPLWDQREGPLAAARAQQRRATHLAEHTGFDLAHELELAYRQHEIAITRIAAYESGILAQAAHALRIAEAAYRHGERGILDYLDARRVWRATRSDLINARHEARLSAVEIERLCALQ